MTHPQPSTRTRPQPGAWTSPSAGDQTGAAPRARLTGRVGREDGQVTAFVAVLMLALLAMMGLVSDGGRALAAHLSAVNQAQEAARAGAQALDLDAYRRDGTIRLDPPAAAALAARYVTATGGTLTAVSVRADQITVTVTRADSTRLLALVGKTTIRASGTGTARAQPGPNPPRG